MPGKPGIASQQKESRAAGPDDCNHPARRLFYFFLDIKSQYNYIIATIVSENAAGRTEDIRGR